jgi:hypothetical protein
MGPIYGLRIGSGGLFVLTGLSLLILNSAQKKRRIAAGVTLVLALASLITAIFFASMSPQGTALKTLDVITDPYELYDKDFRTKFMAALWSDPVSGSYYFPLLPWTPIVIVMNSVPLYMLAISIGVLVMGCDLLFETNLDDKDDEDVSTSFASIGTLLILVGISTNITGLCLPNLIYFENGWAIYSGVYGPVTTVTLVFTISGLLALSHSETTLRSFCLFCMSFVILASCLFMIVQLAQVLKMAQKTELKQGEGQTFKNATTFCSIRYGNDRPLIPAKV